MFGTKYKFANLENNFVTFVRDGQSIFQRISLSRTSFLSRGDSGHDVLSRSYILPVKDGEYY